MLAGRRIVVGVTGGIAAYKAAELVRELVRGDVAVRVVMTQHACEFVTPLTFEVLSGQPVSTDLFRRTGGYEIDHIALADFAELLVVAPATANLIGKLAHGIADDLLSTVLLAVTAPVMICPAMNTKMYVNPVVRQNLAVLKDRGYAVLEPGIGALACRAEGQGRLPDVVQIVEEIEALLTTKDLQRERILVTAGPTQEPFDPVRYISNHSSGKMGYALAAMARRRGAVVTLISGPTSLPAPQGVTLVPVRTAMEMYDAVRAHVGQSTVLIKAAAVADYRPESRQETKIKKGEGPLNVTLVRNPDILAEVAREKQDRIVVGFSMESDHLLEYARAKLFGKKMDFIVANDVTEPGAGFGTDTNIVRILDRAGNVTEYPLMDKHEVANVILDRVRQVRSEKGATE